MTSASLQGGCPEGQGGQAERRQHDAGRRGDDLSADHASGNAHREVWQEEDVVECLEVSPQKGTVQEGVAVIARRTTDRIQPVCYRNQGRLRSAETMWRDSQPVRAGNEIDGQPRDLNAWSPRR